MGLLDGFLADNPNDPRYGANMALFAGMMAGNLPQGLLQHSQIMSEAQDKALKRGLLSAQIKGEEAQAAERQAKQEADARRQMFLQSLPSPDFMAGQVGLAGGGGPTNANAQRMPQVSPFQSLLHQGAQAGAVPFGDYVNSFKPQDVPINKLDVKDFTPASVQRFAQTRNYGDLERMDKLHFADRGGAIAGLNPFTGQQVGQVAKTGNPFSDLLVTDARGGMMPNAPLIDAKSQIARAGASNVSVNTGQKGLDNELKIRGDFRSEPIYKAHGEVQSAHAQISQALQQASPAGDLAGATKLMKILDPGSVVRESELGMAMAASGLLDRVTNYANMVTSGEKLTPTQRKDFQQLADSLMNESVKQYNAKRSEYEPFATDYGLNANRILGQPAAGAAVKPKTFDSLPKDAQNYKGKIATDTTTGKKYRSNGMSWVEEK